MLTGCATNPPACKHSLPPIYTSKDDVLTDSTDVQITTHNCTVDYDKDVCKPKEKQ